MEMPARHTGTPILHLLADALIQRDLQEVLYQ